MEPYLMEVTEPTIAFTHSRARHIATLGAYPVIMAAFTFLFAVAVFGQAQGEAVDDFYIIDGQQYINVGENDNPRNQLWIIDPAFRGTVVTCAASGCPDGTLLYTPPASGYDKFRYCWGQLDWTGSTVQCHVRIATVTLLSTGDGSQDYGRSCQMESPGPSVPRPPSSVGQPVNVTNGNMWLEQSDYTLPGVGESIQINRFYNSQRQSAGLFGFGWSTKYDESLTIYDLGMVRLNLPDGKGAYFGRPNSGVPFVSFSPDVVGQLVKETDNSYTLTFLDGRIHKFDTVGRLAWQRDRLGNQTTLGYTGGHLTTLTDPTGRTLSLTPNSDGTISQISDSIGVVATYEYFPSTTVLETVIYPDGSKYKFEYDTTSASGKILLSTVKDALDNILETHIYDSQGRATTSEKDGGVEEYTIDYTNSGLTTGAFTKVTDALGRETTYYFHKKNGKKLITETVGACSCGSTGSETNTYEYDYRQNLAKKTDALGRVTTYSYNHNRNLIQSTDSLGVHKWTYNSRGQVETYKDRVDQATTNNTLVNTYDPATGNLLTTTDRLGHTTTMSYTSLGQLATLTDARNNPTTFTYDTQGRLIEVTDANNRDTTFAYDARARIVSVTNAKNETTTFEYDLNNRLKKVTFPDTNYTENTYDLAGRRIQFRNARAKITTFSYDDAYRLTSITDPLNHTKILGYDLMSNLTSRTDALGNTTNFEYDDFDRLKKVIYPPATTGATRLEESVTYDKVGNVKTLVDTAGRTTAYNYDNLNRLIKITDALTNVTNFEYNLRSQMEKVKDALNQEYVFTYDPLGRVLTQTRAGTTMTFEYDPVGNQTKRTDHNGTVTNYTYDNLNRLTSGSLGTYTYDDVSQMLTASNQNGTVSFTYDNRGRVDTTTDVYGKVIDYDYDAEGNRTLLKLDGVNLTAYAYDNDGRLSMLINHASYGVSQFFYDAADRLTTRWYPYSVALRNRVTTTHQYDGMSRLKRTTDKRDFTTLFDRQYSYNDASQISQITEPSRSRTYTYDDLDRLTAVTDSVSGNESYAYDAVGNRTSSHLSSSYTYGPFNRLTNTVTASYVYDNNGAMTSRTDSGGTMSFAYDADGRLLNSQNSLSQLNEFKYDALGRRVFTDNPGQPQVKYTYDGENVVLMDSAGIITKYQNGPGIDNKLGVNVTGASWPQYFLSDHLGTTTGTITPNGTFSARPAIDAFGNGSSDFTGREYDSFSGNTYYRARIYDPKLGRFISEDPNGFAGGDINLYGYVKNRPTMFRDPSGKIPVVAVVIIGLAVAGEGALHLYLESRARSIAWSGGDNYGRSKHCYVTCMSTRIHLGNPTVVTAGGLGQEVVNTLQGAEVTESLGDLSANSTGVLNAYMIWRSCEELCKTCQ